MNHEALMRSYYATYNSENPAALRAFYADDVVLLSSQGEMRGPDAILATYQYLISMFEDRMVPTVIRTEGDTAVVDITDTFTAKQDVADFMGASLQKGEQMVMQLRGTYRIRDNRFIHITIEMRS